MINMENNYNTIIKEIKKDFFRFRNGILADKLRKIYPADKMIYGLTVIELMKIAKDYPHDLNLGLELWKDKNNRESRLLALYIIPPEEIDKETVKGMINDVESSEEAEFLAFKILRHLPFANELYMDISSSGRSPSSAYCVEMFRKNLDQI